MALKKHFGQHFLKSPHYAKFIAEQMLHWGKSYSDLIEIGPGAGALTNHLVPMTSEGKKLILVELDQDLIQNLELKFASQNVTVLFNDFLKLDKQLPQSDFGVIGNFPYNISSQIVFKVIENRTQIPEMVGMFQKEVAQRIAAKPGSKVYGILSVWAQAFYHVSKVLDLKPGDFNPPPKVDSQVIRFDRYRTTIPDLDEKLLLKVIKAAFGQRRKTLRNALSGFLHDIKEATDLEPFLGSRAEQLSVEQFIVVTQIIASYRAEN